MFSPRETQKRELGPGALFFFPPACNFLVFSGRKTPCGGRRGITNATGGLLSIGHTRSWRSAGFRRHYRYKLISHNYRYNGAPLLVLRLSYQNLAGQSPTTNNGVCVAAAHAGQSPALPPQRIPVRLSFPTASSLTIQHSQSSIISRACIIPVTPGSRFSPPSVQICSIRDMQ